MQEAAVVSVTAKSQYWLEELSKIMKNIRIVSVQLDLWNKPCIIR
jgi:hypothetical protein